MQLLVRQQDGVIATIRCNSSLLVSDVIARIAPGLSVLVYHGIRLLRNDDIIHSLELDAGCCLEIHECLGGGGGGCSRIRPVDDVSVLDNVDDTANAHESNRKTVQHINPTEGLQTVGFLPPEEDTIVAAATGICEPQGGTLTKNEYVSSG
jgi:hypothetical protein